MTTLQLALGAGMIVGLGAALLVLRLAPAQPQLAGALERLAPERHDGPAEEIVGNGSMQDRIGLYLQRRLRTGGWLRIPRSELTLLRIPVHRYLGEKALFALIGLLFPPAATFLFALIGFVPPVVVPVGGSILLAAGLSFVPDYNVRDEAKNARQEFSHALSAYIDGVALERDIGAGVTQALRIAASEGDSWVFQRLREELERARLNGDPPWDGLTQLAQELGLPELSDLADSARLGGEKGATIYKALRDRAASLRESLLNAEHTRANAAGERMTIPASMLALVFLAILATPAALRIFFPGRA